MKVSRTKPTQAQTYNQLSQGTKVSGNLEVSIPLRIDGELEGDVISTDKVVTGESSIINGSIEADEIIIGGQFFGSIRAKKLLIIQSTGSIEGHIQTPAMSMEQGGFFKGDCQMSSDLPVVPLVAKQA